MVRKATLEDIESILQVLRSDEKLDASSMTFSKEYVTRMIQEEVCLVSKNGVLIGKYREDEGWADIIIDSAPKQELDELIDAYREILPDTIKTIDVFAHPEHESIYAMQGFAVGQKYVAMRENL